VLAATQNVSNLNLHAKLVSGGWGTHWVQPAATRHPVHIFFSFSTLLFSSVLKMTQNLVVWVGHQGARPAEIENLKISPAQVFS
jgi:hypothetical protein